MPEIRTPEAARVLLNEGAPGVAYAPGSTEAATLERRVASMDSEDNPLAVLAGRDIPSSKMATGIHKDKLGTVADRNTANTEYARLSTIVRGGNYRLLAATTEVTAVFESLILQNPTLHAQYTALAPAEQQGFRERYLSDKRLRNEIANVLKDKVTISGIEDDKVGEKKEEHDKLKEEQQKLNDERVRLITERQSAETELAQYESTIDATTRNITYGKYTQELSRIEMLISENTSEVAILTESITSGRQRLESLTSNRGLLRRSKGTFDAAIDSAYDQEINGLESQITGYRTQLSLAQKRLANASTAKDSINARKDSLTKIVTNTTERIREIDRRLNGDENSEGLVIELRAAKAELTQAIKEKKDNGQKYLDELQSILPEAVRKIMQQNINGVVAAERAELDERRANATTELERNLIDSIANRYIDGNVTNWANFENDYVLLMSQGVDFVITTMLPAGTTIDEFRRSNPELHKKITEDITKELLKLRMRQPREGGRLRQLLGPRPMSEAEILVMTTRIGDEGFKKALAENKEVRSLLSEGIKDKVVNIDGKITEGIKKLPMGKILLILAALLGIGLFKGASA